MPTVPIPEQSLQARGPVAFQAEAVKPVQDFASKQMVETGNVMMKLGADIIDDVNKSRTAEAVNQFNNRVLDRQLEVFKLKGKDALQGVDGQDTPSYFTNKLSEDVAEIAKGLGNDAQRKMFLSRAAEGVTRFRGVVNTHLIEQQKAYDNETDTAALSTAMRNASLAQSSVDPTNIATVQAANNAYVQSTADIAATIDRIAKRNGWDDKIKESKMVEAMSAMHTGIIRSMIETNRPAEAEAHFKANKGMMTMAAREEVGKIVKTGIVLKTADEGAEKIWGELGPKGINDPVKLFDMEKKARELFGDNPDVVKNVIGGLRERGQAFNAQQSEVNTANTNKVFEQIVAGTPMTQIQRSASWISLPAAKQNELISLIEREGKPAQRQEELRVRGEMISMALGDPETFIKEFRDNGFTGRSSLGIGGIKEMQNIAMDIINNNGRWRTVFDQKVLQDAIPKALLAPAKKDQRDAFVAVMSEETTKWIKANPGKQPTPEAYQQVIKAANEEWISLGLWNSGKKAYEVRATNDPKAVPKWFYNGMKAEGATEDEILAAWNIKKTQK